MEQFRRFLSKGRKVLLPAGDAISRIPVVDMLAHNWHLGLTSFGGPTVHFQIFRKLFVDRYQWLDDAHYDEMFAICQALSGPGSTKMLYAINIYRYGFWTGLAAFAIWSLPMAIAAFGLAIGVSSIDNQLPGPVYALLSGLNAATVGIIALAAVQLSQKAITDTLTRILVFLGACAGMLYNALWYFPVIMVVGSLTAMCYDLKVFSKLWSALRKTQSPETPQAAQQDQEIGPVTTSTHASGVSITTSTANHQDGSEIALTTQPPQQNKYPKLLRSWKSGSLVLATFLLSFTIIMITRGLFSSHSRAFDLFANLYLAGTIIFGGGPVVVPLLREYIVAPGWVSPRDFLLGLAITQAFPGPNFNFAVYLGTLAVRGTGISPVAGAILAYLGIFAPGLWIMTGTLGLWSSVRKNRVVRSCLRGIHATAVGLVFTAVYRLFEIGYLDAEVRNGGSLSRDPWWVVVVATSFVGGMHFKLAPALAIALGSVMGLIWYGVVRA